MSLTQPLISVTDRIERRLPVRLSPHTALSILARYHHVSGSAYKERRYLKFDYALALPTPSGFMHFESSFTVLRLPGTRLAEAPAPPSDEWERVGGDDDDDDHDHGVTA